ncbi:MAG: hypothetical protein RIE59_28350, partial [Imperialibacter sp.]
MVTSDYGLSTFGRLTIANADTSAIVPTPPSVFGLLTPLLNHTYLALIPQRFKSGDHQAVVDLEAV